MTVSIDDGESIHRLCWGWVSIGDGIHRSELVIYS